MLLALVVLKQQHKHFRSACNEFKYFEYLDDEEEELAPKVVEADKDELERTIKGVIIENGMENRIPII